MSCHWYKGKKASAQKADTPGADKEVVASNIWHLASVTEKTTENFWEWEEGVQQILDTLPVCWCTVVPDPVALFWPRKVFLGGHAPSFTGNLSTQLVQFSTTLLTAEEDLQKLRVCVRCLKINLC